MKVKDIMTKDVIKVDKDERLPVVLDLMKQHNVTKIPVVNDGEFVGVIYDGDIADQLGSVRNRGISVATLHASSVMRRNPPTVGTETDVANIVELCRKEDVGIIPVTHDNTLVGVVTKADLLRFVTSDRPVKDFMITRLYAVDPTDRVVHARRLMLDNGVERLPVLDGGVLVGIVSEADIALGFAALKARVRDNHQQEALKRFFVEDVMQRKVVHTTPETPAHEAATTMSENHVGGLPIIQNGDGKIGGFITRTDLIRLIEPPLTH